MRPKTPVFYEVGSVADKINVEISFQIIGLFSEGLYSSPNKAIEELVSNAFDADATKVHVVVGPNREGPDGSIAVFDDGVGMDAAGLKVHWIVGDSIKTRHRLTARGRRTIGKFGIGKLAAYVLGNRLTHITKVGGKYYSTTMDFGRIPRTVDVDEPQASQAAKSAPVTLDLRVLTAAQARAALAPWLSERDGRKQLRLFGRGAAPTWTAAIISDLKPMAADLSVPTLRWVLSTAMPLRDDFWLYLNNERVQSSKLTATRVGHWVLGKRDGVTSLPKPGPRDIETSRDDLVGASDYRHWVMIDKLLGPVTGYVEVYDSPVDVGKSEKVVGRSNGFFVYVHERLINPDDAGFGIDRNKLRHGTFSNFRVVVNMDRLDDELRSSRESLRDGPLQVRAQQILQALFNFARAKLEEHERASTTSHKAWQRLYDTPTNLTVRPIERLLLDAYEGDVTPRHLTPVDHDIFSSKDAVLEHIEARVAADAGIVETIAYEDLGPHMPMAVLDAISGRLSINLEHPFVAHFADEFGDKNKNLPLQLFAISEVLLEAQLHDLDVAPDVLASVLDQRDALLRHLARSSGAQSSLAVAQRLMESASSKKELEDALVLVFNQLGYEAVPKGGNDEADGLAEAFLAGGSEGVNRYRVSLEAKSKEKPGGRVKKKAVEVSTIVRHRDETNCDHAFVVGPEFETGADDLGAVMREIAADRKANPGKSITLMRIRDLARLVRLAPVYRLHLGSLRDLFITASSPTEAAAWVNAVTATEPTPAPYQTILETVWQIQQEDQEHSVDYGSLRTALRTLKTHRIGDRELRTECLALSRMAPDMFFASDDRVELNIRPDKVLPILHDYVERVPVENEE